MKATALDVEVFHQNHTGEETLRRRQVERLGDPAERFEQGILAFQAVSGFGCPSFGSHFQQGIDGSAMFFDETFHSAGQVLNTLGLQDQAGLTQLGDHARQHEHADGFIAWSESFESGGQDRFQAFAQQALFELALFLALWMRQALGAHPG